MSMHATTWLLHSIMVVALHRETNNYIERIKYLHIKCRGDI